MRVVSLLHDARVAQFSLLGFVDQTGSFVLQHANGFTRVLLESTVLNEI